MAGKDVTPRPIVQKSVDEVLARGKGEGREHLVSIVHQNGCCKVEPAVLHASPGDTIFWKFDGSADGGRLFFPHKGLFNKDSHDIPPPHAESEGLPMRLVGRGRYPYAVYCKAHNCFAVGNSDPRIDYP